MLRSAAILLLIAVGAAFAAAEEDFAPPFEVTSKLSSAEVPPGGQFALTVRFVLGKDVHLYKDKIKFQWATLAGAKEEGIAWPKAATIPDLNSDQPGATTEAYEGSADIVVRLRATGGVPRAGERSGEPIVLKGTVAYQGCTNTMCFRPMKTAIEHELKIVAGAASAAPVAAATDGGERLGWAGILKHLAAALVAGLLISLTPCVYPMIPITMAVIGGRGQRSRGQAILLSMVYVLGIALTYSALGVLVASLGASVRLAFQSPYLLVPIAAAFVLLALSMFDVVTIQAPGSLGGLRERLAGKTRGVAGVLLIGVLSGLVAGPCVAAPLLGMLVDIAREGDRVLGALRMFALAWGMGVLLIVAGASTGLLPKAGAWTVWVKKLFGFVLLWAAVYFLRPVTGETAYWLGSAAVVLAGAVFLGGMDALTAESGFAERTKRFLGWVAVFAAGAMMLMVLQAGASHGLLRNVPQVQASPLVQGDPREVELALRSGRPVLLDFTAEWCGYCKVLDRTTFSDPRIAAELERFRAFAIDVDDHKNAELVKRYDVPGPPLIVILDSQGKVVHKLGYDAVRNTGEFLDLLKKIP